MAVSAEDIKRVKGMGFLNNRGTDLFSGRIITENGVLTAGSSPCWVRLRTGSATAR